MTNYFVKGDAIPNAVQYALCKKNADGTYTQIATQEAIREVGLGAMGYCADDGTFENDSNYMRNVPTEVAKLTNLQGYENTCVTPLLRPGDHYAAVFVYYENGYSMFTAPVFKAGLRYDELMSLGTSAKKIKEYAESVGANHIVFVTAITADNYIFNVGTLNDINFYLNSPTDTTISNQLPAGQTYKLVVKAIGEGGVDLDGDGVIYDDSDYCLGADGNPLSYTV